MINKKISNISLSVDSETQELLKTVAKKRKVSVSKLVRDIVEKHLSPTEEHEDVDTVIFKIPNNAKATEVDLRNWLSPRVENIVKALAMDIAKTRNI